MQRDEQNKEIIFKCICFKNIKLDQKIKRRRRIKDGFIDIY